MTRIQNSSNAQCIIEGEETPFSRVTPAVFRKEKNRKGRKTKQGRNF
jgi:hypothetical protein